MHANAPLTPAGRLILCERIAAGRPISHVAQEMRISRQRAGVWYRRWQADGEAGLVDRRSTLTLPSWQAGWDRQNAPRVRTSTSYLGVSQRAPLGSPSVCVSTAFVDRLRERHQAVSPPKAPRDTYEERDECSTQLPLENSRQRDSAFQRR